jgi:hypothetical protein
MKPTHENRDHDKSTKRSVVVETLSRLILEQGRVVLRDVDLPVCRDALADLQRHDYSACLPIVSLFTSVTVDLVSIDRESRYATAIVVGGKSSEQSPQTTSQQARLLRAAEFTLVHYLRQLGHPVDIAVTAVVTFGEMTSFPDEIVVRGEEIDSLLDLDAYSHVINAIIKASKTNKSIHRPRTVRVSI